VASWSLVATRIGNASREISANDAKFDWANKTSSYQVHLATTPPAKITVGQPFVVSSWATAARTGDEGGIDFAIGIRFYRDEEGQETLPGAYNGQPLAGMMEGTLAGPVGRLEQEKWVPASNARLVLRPHPDLPDTFQIKMLVVQGAFVEPHFLDWVTFVYRRDR
jgi:hypothetical protein